MYRCFLKKIFLFSPFFLIALFYCYPAAAQSEEEMKMLRLFYKEDELVVVSPTRSPKPISQVAENITVITSEDIEMMNAHTLADVLYTVNGVQVSFAGSSPGNIANILIQGSEMRHVAVFMDGIPLNNLNNNVTEIGSIPVQQIEKIEIIKGPASSAWGSSLGGVINIITKSPADKERLNGMLSASYGGKNTGDLRAEINGKKEKFGYYISAGRLKTDGFMPENDVSADNIYTKLSYDLSSNTSILFSMLYARASRGDYEDREADIFGRDKNEHLHSNLSLNTILSKEASLNISLRSSVWDQKVFDYLISDGSEINKLTIKDSVYGASAKLTLNHGIHSVVIGSDYDDGALKSNIIKDGEQGIRKWAVFANDTVAIKKLSITPGIRYDNTDTNGDFISPSIGATYNITENTLIRAYAARGFNIPPLFTTYGDNIYLIHNPDLKVEKVWSYQAGMETGSLKYLWLKLSGFRHDIKDGIVYEVISIDPVTNIPTSMAVNKDKIRRQGFELEMKTITIYNMYLFAGTTYVKSKNRITGEEIKDVPKYTYNVGLHYDDRKSFRAMLRGNYTWWNASDWHLAKYSSFIFDVNLIKTIYEQKTNRVEIFLTAHNIFNSSQYWDYWYKNAQRWIEGGVRYKF